MNKNISVIIPTFGREQILLDTLAGLIKQIESGDEILVMDQTLRHEIETEKQLTAWNESRLIRWIRLKERSVVKAMNYGAIQAKTNLLLFLDDDIVPGSELLKAHKEAYQEHDVWAAVGRITQPWQSKGPQKESAFNIGKAKEFDFNSLGRQYIHEAMAGNLSVLKSRFIEIGGFDENFKGVAYSFEKEFAERLIEHGGKILFEPLAHIQHLQSLKGGVRSLGDFSKTFLPFHSVGNYYYFFRSKVVKNKLQRSLERILKSVCTRYHLLRPWWIPCVLIAEISGLFWGLSLYLQGPRLMDPTTYKEYGK